MPALCARVALCACIGVPMKDGHDGGGSGAGKRAGAGDSATQSESESESEDSDEGSDDGERSVLLISFSTPLLFAHIYSFVCSSLLDSTASHIIIELGKHTVRLGANTREFESSPVVVSTRQLPEDDGGDPTGIEQAIRVGAERLMGSARYLNGVSVLLLEGASQR